MTKVAAIDCGTNSLRLLITDDGRDVVRLMRIVRLGQGVDRTGRLDPAAIERTRVALAEYRSLIDAEGVTAVRMVATSAGRDASNADDFHRMVAATLGRPAEIVSGDEEASLSFRGAVAGLDGTAQKLVVDIGGGSTEFVRGIDTVLAARSMDIGAVRMTERHLHSDPPTAPQLAAAEADIAAHVAEGLAAVGAAGLGDEITVVGVAGTITTVAGIALGLREYDSARIHHSALTAADVEAVTEWLCHLDHDGRAAITVIHPGRLDVITAGSLILREVLRQTGASGLVVSEHDILDGIAATVVG